MEANAVIERLKSTPYPRTVFEKLQREIQQLDFETQEALYVSLSAEKAKPENGCVFSMLVELLGFLRRKIE